MKLRYEFRIFKFAVLLFILLFISVYFIAAGRSRRMPRYAGSNECMRCHESVYNRWKNTPHANALFIAGRIEAFPGYRAAAARHAAAGIKGEIIYAIGNHWTQRYLLSDKCVSPLVYSLQANALLDYFDVNYKRSNYERECIGCHTTGAVVNKTARPDERELTYAQAGVACEACHGPGGAHIDFSDARRIVNPAKLSAQRRDMICMSCHTNGFDKSGMYKFPLNYKPGDDLRESFFNPAPRPGQLKYNYNNRFDYKADGSFEDRKRQYDYWRFIFLASEGFSCDDCLDFRGSSVKTKSFKNYEVSLRFKPSHTKKRPVFFQINEYCMSCHASLSPFFEYAAAPEKNMTLKKTKCTFINKKINLEDQSASYSCVECHKSGSVHDHYYIPDRSDFIDY